MFDSQRSGVIIRWVNLITESKVLFWKECIEKRLVVIVTSDVIFHNLQTYTFVKGSFFMTAPLEMFALTTSRIYLMIYLIDSTNIDKICD